MAFQQWLRGQRARLIDCRDCFGDRAAVEAKLQRAQALAAELPQGEELVRRAAALGEEMGGGARQESAAVKTDFASFAGEVDAAVKSLGRCRQLWELFESSRTAFAEDIGVLEEQLRRRPTLRTTPQEKRQQLAQCQRQHEQLLAKQADLDTLQSRVQELLAINPDSRLSQTATQLATRYQSLVALSNEQLTRQEGVLNDHVSFQTACDDFCGWAASTREELLQLDRRAKSRADLERAQPRLAALQKEVEEGAERLKVAEDLGERTASHTDPGGCAALRETMDELRRNFTEIRDQVGRQRAAYDTAAAGLSEFDRNAEQLDAWMRDSEGRLSNGAAEPAEDLGGKKAALERLRVLASEMAAKKAAVDRLTNRARDLEDPQLNEQAEEVVRKHARLLANAKENVAKLEKSVSGQEEYRAATEHARDWFASARQRLQRLRDPQGNQRELESRLEGFRPFKADLAKEGQALVERVDHFANQMLNTNPPNREEVLREIDGVHNDLAVLTTETEQVEAQQVALVEQWHEFVEQCQQFNDWLREVDSSLKRHVDHGPDFDSKQRQAKEYEIILEDIYGHKSDLERLRESANSLLQRTQDTSGQTKVLQYTSRYQSLQTTCQETHQRLEALAKEHKFYEDSMEDAVSWIESTTQKLLQCSDIAGDQAALRDKITVVKEIARSLDDGQTRLNTTLDAADKVLKKTPREGAEKVRKQTEELRQNWNEVNTQLASVSGALSTVAAKWNDYEELHQRLDRWLQDTERAAEALSVPKSDLVERKARLEKFQEKISRFKNLQRDLDKYEPEVEELQRICDELQAGGPQPAVEEQSTALTSRFCVLKGRVIERLQVLDQAHREYMRYLEALQKCEKWIVQASFKIMTQSAGPCSTLEATQTQMERHSSTAREIAEQRKQVDQVVSYGRKVMEDSSHNGDIVEEIQGELGKLEDEYKNLQEKSDQLGERLKENVGKWRAYKDQIQGAEKFLRGELSSWWMDKEHPEAESLADVGKQVEDTRKMMDRLHRLRSDIGAAAHRCEAVTLSASRPPSRNAASRSRPRTPLLTGPTSGFESPLLSPTSPDPLPTDSPFSRQAEKVNRELKENVEKMERRLDSLAGERTKWEDADRSKEDFRAWVREKQQELRELAPNGRSGAKMEPEQAEREVQRLQAFLDELHRNGNDLRALEDTYSNLTQHKPGQPDGGLRAARDDYEDLLGQASNHLAQRRDFLEQYGRDQEMEELIKKVQAQQVAHARGDNSKGTQTLRHHGTQTPSANSAHDALDGAGSDWMVGSAQGRSPNPEDPIESLRRTLRELDGQESGGPSSRRPSRRSQTEPGHEQKLTQTVADEATQTKRSRKPTRQAALRSLLNSVRSIKEELARSEEAKLPAIPPLPTQDLAPPVSEPLSLRSPFSAPRGHSPSRMRSPEMESVRRNGPILQPRSPDLPLSPSPSFDRRPLPVGRSPPPPTARSVSFSPPVRGSPSGRTLSPEPERPRSQYGLPQDAMRDYIPTKPHWRGEAPLPLSNGFDALSNGSPLMTSRSASPGRPMQMTEMVRDYNSMLKDSGNAKRSRGSRPSSRSSRR